MKIFLFTLCLICFLGKDKDFKIIEATVQSWSGRVAGNEGTVYDILIKCNTTEKINIDQVWINDKFYYPDIYIKTNGHYKNDSCFNINDTVLIKAIDSRWQSYRNKTDTISPPFKYEGAGLIGYIVDNTRKYKTIKELKQLKRLAYP